MSTPLVSIITPIYNGKQYISETIKSALAQTYKNFELLLINDGSTDNSAEIIRSYFNDERIIYIEQKNSGVASARNTAIRVAKGKYIGFLDQDDLWHKNKLEEQVAILENDENIALIHSKQDFIDSQGNEINFNWIIGGTGDCFADIFIKNKIAVLTVLIRKTILDEIGLFNEQLSGADDYEMWLRVTLRHPIKYLDIPLATYRFHDNNISKNSFKMTILELNTINSIIFNYPEVLKKIPKKTIRNRLYSLNTQLGEWYSWHDKNFYQARKHFFIAIINNPLVLKSYFMFLHCLLSNNQRKTINWYLHKLNNIFSKI
jgi:glycosyltransferase involved in cell wall biosynthesis